VRPVPPRVQTISLATFGSLSTSHLKTWAAVSHGSESKIKFETKVAIFGYFVTDFGATVIGVNVDGLLH